MNREFDETTRSLRETKKSNEKLQERLSKNEELSDQLYNFLATLDLEELTSTNKQIGEKSDELTAIIDSIMKAEEALERYERKGHLLEEVPCGDKFPTCKFLQDAYEALEKIPQTGQVLVQLGATEESLSETIEKLNPQQTRKYLEDYRNTESRKRDVDRSISTTKMEIERNDSQVAHMELILQNLSEQKEEYEANKEAIDSLEVLIWRKRILLKLLRLHLVS